MLSQVFDEETAAAPSTWARAVPRPRAANIGSWLPLFQVKGHKQDSVVTWTIHFVWKRNIGEKDNASSRKNFLNMNFSSLNHEQLEEKHLGFV